VLVELSVMEQRYQAVLALVQEGERSRRQLVSLLRRLQKRYPVASIARAAKVTPWRSGTSSSRRPR